MSENELINGALRTWAAKDLPARLHSMQVAKLLNCTPDDVTILVGAGKLRPLGKPRPNAVKLFSAIELITLISNRDWLDDVTKTIGQFWRRKNERRKGITASADEKIGLDAVRTKAEKTSTKPSTPVLRPCAGGVKTGISPMVAEAA